jgi:hypothetical protein
MASAGNGLAVVSTVGVEIFDPDVDGECAQFSIFNRTGGATVLVNVENLHNAGEFIGIPAGQGLAFRVGDNNVGTITVKVASGTATLDYGKQAIL